MSRFARRSIAALRRAVAFYRGTARFALGSVGALIAAGWLLPSSWRNALLLVALALTGAVVVFAGSRAHRVAQDRLAAPEASKTPAMTPEVGGVGADGPLVSVVVTAHDDARFVQDCIESIRSQTWASWECILVDDSSTDDTLDLAVDTANGDPRFRFVSLRSPEGVSTARNVGLDEVSGEFVTFLDADDFLFARSLETRALALADRRTLPGVVGVFCDWVGVPESAERSSEGRAAMHRARITWFDASDGAPVINSAPLLITSELRKIGGYRESWAEDADLWNRLLRHGYVLDPVPYNGVAYRQKAASRFRTSASAHADAMTAIADANRDPMSADANAGTTFTYVEGVDSYRPVLGRLNRHLIGMTTAQSNGDDRGVREFLEVLAADWKPYAWMAIDVESVVRAAAMRHEAYEDEGRAERAERTTRAVVGMLEARLPAPDWRSDERRVVQLAVGTSRRSVRDRVRREVDQAQMGELVDEAVVLMPAVGYHVDEMGPLAEELDRRGRKAIFAISERRWPDVRQAVRRFTVPMVSCPDPGEWVEAAAGYVTLNDWGELYRDVIVEAKSKGVPTFGKVEGAQDFEDADVDWERRAYRTVDHVLCQGPNDVAALPSSSTCIVGSSRLEAIWKLPPRAAGQDLVVLNSNFTYEVMSEERDGWLEAAATACESLGMPYVISKHPSERPLRGNPHVASEPMKHLLTKASVLVSRFSTVPFEAMARGVPFVYFNPHGETVPTFREPDSAFEVALDEVDLAAAIKASREWRDSYRERCDRFFLAQVDIDQSASPAARTAEVIESIVFS